MLRSGSLPVVGQASSGVTSRLENLLAVQNACRVPNGDTFGMADNSYFSALISPTYHGASPLMKLSKEQNSKLSDLYKAMFDSQASREVNQNCLNNHRTQLKEQKSSPSKFMERGKAIPNRIESTATNKEIEQQIPTSTRILYKNKKEERTDEDLNNQQYICSYCQKDFRRPDILSR